MPTKTITGGDQFTSRASDEVKFNLPSAGQQFAAKAGEQVKNIKTGETITSTAVQDVGGGNQGQFFSSDFELIPPTDIPGVTGAATISEGTDDLQNQLDTDINDLGTDIAGAGAGAPSVASQLSDLEAIRANIGTTTDADLKQIEEAGAAAGGQFDPLITEAEESRKTELARGIVRAGEAGGFESTQLAGTAAVLPTDPKTGEAFVGAGGKLSAQRQVLDRNISTLRSAQQQAIAAAKAAERSFIESGKREDYNMAVDAVKLANDLKNDAENMSIKKDQLFLQQQEFGLDVSAEDRALRRETREEAMFPFEQAKLIADTMAKIPAGQQFEVDGQLFTGIAAEEVDPFFSGSNLVALMKELPAGEVRTLTDPNTGVEHTIVGISSEDPNVKTIQSTNDRGEVTITSYNKDTGEIVNQVSAGGVGKTKTRAASTTIVLNEQQAGILGDAAVTLNATIGDDGFFNTEAFVREREKVAASPGGDVGKFDEVFTPRLNPQDPGARRFLTPSEISVTEETEKSPKDIIAEKLGSIDIKIE